MNNLDFVQDQIDSDAQLEWLANNWDHFSTFDKFRMFFLVMWYTTLHRIQELLDF